MNNLNSLTFQFKNQLRIDQIIKISQLAKSYNGNIYLVTKNESVINVENLSTFITYLLTVKNGQVMNLIIKGPYPHLKLNDLQQIITKTTKTRKEKRRILQPAVK